MATERNVKMIAGDQPVREEQVFITTRQHEHGVQIVATRGRDSSVLLTISNNFRVQLNRGINVLLGFERNDNGLSLVIDPETLPQPQRMVE